MTEKKYLERKTELIEFNSYGRKDSLESCLYDRCAECRGGCCKNYPCTLSPKEFLDIKDIDYMKGVLDTGVITIAPMNMASTFYIIRPRGINDFDTVATGYAMEPNSCILQGENGCILEPMVRPTEGLLLIPVEEPTFISCGCKCYYSDFSIMRDWKKYQSTLKKLMKIYKDKEVPKPEINEETAKVYKLKLLGM